MSRLPDPPLAISLGDPAGIGPEVIAKCWDNRSAFNLPPFVAIGDARSIASVWDGPIEIIADPRETDAAFDYGLPLLDLALWLADFPDPVRVSAHMERGRGATAVEDSMLVQLECAQGKTFAFDVSWSYVGTEDRWWFEVLATRGSARLGPLRVFKELNGKPVEVSPTGAAARESAFVQSYRAELAHFLAVLRGEASYEAPDDQLIVHRVTEAIYKSADEGKEIRL